MLRATLRSLLARKLRLLLASTAVLLGVSFVSGAFVLTDSLSRVFDNLFASINAGTSVTVQGVSALGDDGFDTSSREPVTQPVLDAVRKVDGVRDVVGQVNGNAQLVLPSGKVYTTGGPPILGVAFHADSPQESFQIRRGTAPQGVDQVALDATTAAKAHLEVGDRIGVIGKQPRRTTTVVGIIGLRNVGTVAGATLLAYDAASAQQLFGVPGTWTQLSVAADPGVSDVQLRERISAVLPPGVEAKTTAQAVADDSKALKEGLGFFNTFLLAFAGISLFVGAFLIFNTFSMLVAQRTRELALMRALGASRAQVTRSVLVEAVLVGAVSSLGGFLLGIAVALGLRGLLGALGIELPSGDTVIATRTFVVSLLVGVGVTAVAALVPARRAAKVAPVQAMRESGPAEERALGRRTTVGAVVLALGVAALAFGLSRGAFALVGLGAALSFLGVTILSPLFARPVVGLLGLPFARAGIAGTLGRGNAMRSPRRTSATAAALMIGLALVATISTLGASTKKSVVKLVSTSLGADYVLHTDQYQTFSPAALTALQGNPDLSAVAGFRQGQAKIGAAGRVGLQGVDPQALQQVLRLDVLEGDLGRLAEGSLAVSKDELDTLGVEVGDTVPVTWARTGEQPMTIGAVYDRNDFAGGYLVSDATYDANVTDRRVVIIAVTQKPSVTSTAARASIERSLADFPNLQVEDQKQFVKAQGDQIDGLLNAITGLLVLSVLIAVLGIINTLALSVVERTRELGLLRAVGLQRRQMRRMIRVESVVISLYGALLGVGVGLAFGYALVTALHDQGITEFAVPGGRLVVVLVVAALGGVLAAALPARRAARMDVLEAVSAT
jgi:putative ABC transport system permease protein